MLTDSCDFSKEIRRHSPSLVLWSVFTTSLASLALSILYETPEHWREVGEPSQYIRRSIFVLEGRGDDAASKFRAISLTRAIESGTIVASPAVWVGMHLALPLPQLQGGDRGIFPTSLQYHEDSLWLSCG